MRYEMPSITDESAEMDLKKVHEICDKMGAPANVYAWTRVAYLISRYRGWILFLQFLGYDVTIGELDEEKELATTGVLPDTGYCEYCGSGVCTCCS